MMKYFSEKIEQEILSSTTLFDLVKDSIFLMQEDQDSFRYVYVNPSALSLLPNDEIIGKRIEEVFLPKPSLKLIQQYKKVQATQKPMEFTEIIETEGNEFVGETILNPILAEDGRCLYILAIVRDVSEKERKNRELEKVQKNLTEAKEKLEVFWENSSDPIFSIDTKGDILKVNPAFEEMFEFTEEEMISRTGTIIPELIKSDQIEIVERILKGETVNSHETIRITKTGKRLNIISSYSPVRNADKEISGATIIYKDVTKLKKAEKELQKSQEKYKMITESTFDIITLINLSGQIEYVSPANEKILGHPAHTLIGNPYTVNVHPEDAFELMEIITSLIDAGAPKVAEIRFLHKEGHYIWMEVSPTPILVDGQVKQLFTIARDITERRRLQEKIAKMAFYDHLSDIPNRRTFDDKLQKAILQANASGKKVAILMLDGRKFKQINDQFGHDAGDAVIKEMAQRLQACVRPVDTAARLGGDEMGVIIPEIESLEIAETIAKRILKSYEEPLTFNGFDIKMGAGIGISLYPDDTLNEKQLIKYADMALYEAKKSHQDEYRIYQGECKKD